MHSTDDDNRGRWVGFASDDGDGHWVTIGGSGTGDEKSGGSPVFIKDGVITKGAPSLTGKRIDALKEDGTDGTHRQQVNQSKAYARAKAAKEARKDGIPSTHLHQMAAEIVAHDKAFVDDRRSMLKDARDHLASFKGGHINALHAVARAGGDAASIPGLDEVAGDMEKRYPHLFHGGEHASDTLFSILKEGNPERISEEAAYQQAHEVLRDHYQTKGTGGKRPSSVRRAAKKEAYDDEVPFTNQKRPQGDNRGRWAGGK